jgi:predicted phosphohydrolase
MKIQYISDIHLEFLNQNEYENLLKKINIVGDVCVLAGDIGNPYYHNYENFLRFINYRFEKTFLIAGNHEYYRNSIFQTKAQIKNMVNDFQNITFLDNSFEEYNKFRFIGTTQWTEITDPTYEINDLEYINKFSINDYNNLFYEARDFLENAITPNSIVITHHLPIYELTDKKYRNGINNKYNQWFNANLDSFVETNKLNIKAWFYGHTHTRSVKTFYDTTFYCNPLGYKNENYYDDINMICEV